MAAKRERINPGRGGARFVRRGERGEFKEVESVGRSLTQDRARKAKNEAKPGQGDHGDRRTSTATSRGRATSSRTKSSGTKSGAKSNRAKSSGTKSSRAKSSGRSRSSSGGRKGGSKRRGR